jgi:adenylate kinase
MKRHVILLGPPGSGKGTVAHQLEHEFHLEHISTGDWFRREIAQDTELGRSVNAYLARGELVPDEVVLTLIDHFMTEDLIAQGYIFDGFPRTTRQAEALDERCELKHAPIDAVLYLSCPDDVIIERITGRRVCPQCRRVYHLKNFPPLIPHTCDECTSRLVHRADDTEKVIRKRLQQYREATAPLVDYYSASHRLITVNSGPGADVFHVAAASLE